MRINLTGKDKPCIDCKHRAPAFSYEIRAKLGKDGPETGEEILLSRCHRKRMVWNYITAEREALIQNGMLFCQNEREHGFIGARFNGTCGKEGRFFVGLEE